RPITTEFTLFIRTWLTPVLRHGGLSVSALEPQRNAAVACSTFVRPHHGNHNASLPDEAKLPVHGVLPRRAKSTALASLSRGKPSVSRAAAGSAAPAGKLPRMPQGGRTSRIVPCGNSSRDSP